MESLFIQLSDFVYVSIFKINNLMTLMMVLCSRVTYCKIINVLLSTISSNLNQASY